MTSAFFSLTPAAPTAAPVASPASSLSAPPAPSGPGFAQMLSQSRLSQTAMGEAGQQQRVAQSRQAETRAQERAQAAQQADRAARPAPPPSAERGARAERSAAERAEGRGARTAVDESHDTRDAAQAEEATASATDNESDTRDTVLADWLANLHLPSVTPRSASEGGHGEALEADADVADRVAGRDAGARAGRGAAKAGRDAGLDAVGGGSTSASSRAADAGEADAAHAVGGAAADGAHALRETGPSFQHHLNALAPIHGGAGGARAADAAAPVAVHLPVPATEPEFSQALGLQVSVLARGGVQQAELHLNPAEMGPIAIQIALDGTQAQVNFGAESAATRELIERGLPELAASLREAGFTLSGGGVHSQAQGREREAHPGEGRAGARTEALERVGGSGAAGDARQRHALQRTAAGGVDVYA